MKKVIITILLLLISFSKVYALEMCTPSEEWIKYNSLSDEEKLLYTEPVYCKELMDEKDGSMFLSFFKMVNNYISASATDSSYNAYSKGLITSPKMQGVLGTCWAFSSISAVESNALKNGLREYDFSESHMIYSLLGVAYKDEAGKKGKYVTNSFDGGKVTYAASYYFNNYGQLLENDMPYSDTENKIYSSEYKKGNKMISLGGFSLTNVGNYKACSTDEIGYIKKQIINYGSVQASMYMKDNLFSDSGKNYYLTTTNNSNLPNHGISIIGWDDNISASNFNGASRNGAWIIKNSWGPNWSDDGLFYISYDDHFICKNTATFYDVSNKTFDNTYASADMLGVPTFTFSGNFYISGKFNKKTDNVEQLKRVSFPVAQNASYNVYLVSDNNLNSTTSWRQLASGSSEEYGIKSVDLSNTQISDDFTIVVKYYASNSTSIFAMCDSISDTANMEISTNKNFYTSNVSAWRDMASMNVGSQTIGCEPNIYAYTDNTSTPISEPESSVIVNSINESGNDMEANITVTNISDTSSISYKILKSTEDVTNKFTITPNYNTKKVIIKNTGKLSGTFTFIITYNNSSSSKTFELKESVTSNDSNNVIIKSNNIYINIESNTNITYSTLISKLNVKNSNYEVYDIQNNKITSTNAKITTNCKLKLNSSTYTIIIKGDVNEDGKISALDYIEIRKHIMGTTINDPVKSLAADMDSNNKISAVDYIEIRKILMR